MTDDPDKFKKLDPHRAELVGKKVWYYNILRGTRILYKDSDNSRWEILKYHFSLMKKTT